MLKQGTMLIRTLLGGHYVEKQFRSLLLSATLSTVATYVAMLINNITVGNLLGAEALSALTLVSPYLSFVLFVETVVSFGVAICISVEAGRGDTKRANEFFSQGILVALIAGAALCALSFLLRESILTLLSVDALLYKVASEYYASLLLFAFLAPMDCLLLSVMLVEGDKNRMCVAILARLVIHIVLAVLLCGKMGAAGVGIGYSLAVLISMLVMAGHFRSKMNTLHFRAHFCWRDLGRCFRLSMNDASTYLFTMLSTLAFNRFLLLRFGEYSLAIFAVILDILSVVVLGFDGVGAAAEPLLAGYYGEGNSAGLKRTMRICATTAIAESILAAAVLLLSAQWIPALYGLVYSPYRDITATAIRLISISMLFAGLNMLWSSYFTYTNHITIAVINTALRSLVFRVVCVLGLGLLFGLTGIWIGFVAAEALAFLTTHLVVRAEAKRQGELSPLLLDGDRLNKIEVLDFSVTQDGVMTLCDCVEEACLSHGRERKTALRARLLTEEYGMEIVERNAPNDTEGELSIFFLEKVRLTFRDNGRIENALASRGEHAALGARARGTILNSSGGNRYQLYLGDNKTTFEI